MGNETITELINTFVIEAEYVANCFYKKYERKDLLRACHSGVIERSGKIEGLQHYAFHGIGLFARRKNHEIDFDFGLDNRIDGFDSWRLTQFANSRKGIEFKWSEENIQKELDMLEATGKIAKVEGDISSNYYKTTIWS